MNEDWGKETIISIFFYDLPPDGRKKVSYLYDIVGIPKLPEYAYNERDILMGCGISKDVLLSFLYNLNIAQQTEYCLDSTYRLVKSIKRMGSKRLNAKKRRIRTSQEAFPKTDNNVQKGSIK